MENIKFTNPKEELEYLRSLVEEKEKALVNEGLEPDRAEIVSERIVHHAESLAEAPEDYEISDRDSQEVAVSLDPDDNDSTIRELRNILDKKGIKNALKVASNIKSPHIFDDFHRFLVQYIASGIEPRDLKVNDREWKSLHSVLYQVLLPESKESRGERPFKELVSSMEQFYLGMLSVAGDGGSGSFTIELAVPAGAREVSFYVSVPNGKEDLFEKQLLAIFPNAIATKQVNDYNPFVEGGEHVGAYASLEEHSSLSLRTYDTFDYDPLNAVLNAFSKIEEEGGGAALQMIISPRGDEYVDYYKKIKRAFEKGKSAREAFSTPKGSFGEFMKDLREAASSTSKEERHEEGFVDSAMVESIANKISSNVVLTNCRLVVSSGSAANARSMISDIEAAFNQFGSTAGNTIFFTEVQRGKKEKLLRDFSFRVTEKREAMPLSLKELTTMLHFPPEGIVSTPQFKQAKFTDLPAPLDLPQTGTKLGTNSYRGTNTEVFLTEEDRLRHAYVIGQTGTGKTSLLKNMIVQDINAGHGACFIDPHGTDVLDILANIPKERYEDVIYVDPAYMDRSIGLNLLEFDPSRPEQKTFIVNELLAIFRRLYGAVPEAIGPAFEQYFRNATLLVMDSPESGNTMLDIRRIFTDENFRKMKVASAKDQLVKSFWTGIASQATGEQGLENYGPYITNKFDDFVTNEFVRPIIAQEKSSFNFREIMDNKKILLANLSKGRLGERNANFIGLLFVGKIFMDALSRADAPDLRALPPFFLYIDEFQNITTDSIPAILSEARKYKLSLNIAHQFLKQVDESILNAVFGNVGSMIAYRVGPEDAEVFEKQFAPQLSAADLMNIENFNGYAKILANGVPQKPFNIRADKPSEGDRGVIDDLRQLSFLKYGRDRMQIEESVQRRYL